MLHVFWEAPSLDAARRLLAGLRYIDGVWNLEGNQQLTWNESSAVCHTVISIFLLLVTDVFLRLPSRLDPP